MNDSLITPNRERDRRPIRFLVFGIVAILAFGTLTTRLVYLQITNSDVAVARAEAQRTEDQPIAATRGLIFDRQGRPLVNNVATWAVKITPSDLPFSEREDVTQRLAHLLGTEASEILATLDTAPGSRFDPVRVASDVPDETARLVAESSDELPGVEVVVEARRQYTDGPLLSQILGYTGPVDGGTCSKLRSEGYLPDDLLGKTGVESKYETELRGTYGIESVERDATGEDTRCSNNQEAVPGDSLNLTIDRPEAEVRREALKWAHEGGRPQAGRRHRHEPADRRGPRAGQPADATTTTCSRAASATPTTRSWSRIRTSRSSTTRSRRTTRRARPTSSWPGRAAWPTEDQRQDRARARRAT